MTLPAQDGSAYEIDAELLRKLVEERDRIALEALIERYSGLVMGIVRQMLSSRKMPKRPSRRRFSN
ncbi:MAG: hypothetical protein R3C11_22145 [Planctomycetaceae bacterium]